MSFSNNNNNNQNINPRPCVYGCGIQIYWNSSVNEYWEVLTKKRHICPNIVSNKNKTSITPPSKAPKPYYYNSTKKAYFLLQIQNQRCPTHLNCLLVQLKLYKRNMRYYLILYQNIMVRSMVLKGIEILKLVF
jgi:hypothetical protein